MLGKRKAESSTPANVGKSIATRKEKAMYTPVRSLSISALLLLSSFPAWSQSIALGREVHAQALICDSREKAEAVIKTHAEQGIEKATQIAGSTCLSARFVGTPVLVLATRPVGDLTLKVIQIQVRMADNSTTAWFMPTWYEVEKGKEV